MERIHEQIVDITGLVNPQFSSTAVETCVPQVFVLLPPFEEFSAPVYNQVHQEQIVAGEMTLNIVANPAVQVQVIVQEILRRCVAHSAPRRLRSASQRNLNEYMMRSSPSTILFHYHRRA